MTPDEVWAMGWEYNPKINDKQAGVYIVTPKGSKDILYIGKSANIRSRLSQHHVYKKRVHDIYVKFMDDRETINRLEYDLIYHLQPPENVLLYGQVERNRNYVFVVAEPREVDAPTDSMNPDHIAYMRKEYRKVFGA